MPETQERKKQVNLITEELFREAYEYEKIKKLPLRRRISNKLKCTKNTVTNLFPISVWLPAYKWKDYLVNDIIAGITVAIMHIPHGLSYAPLGKVEPVVGLYMAVFPVFMYMIMGTSRQISIGTFAVVCAMVGEIVSQYDPPHEQLKHSNTTELHRKPIYTPIQIGTAVCLLVGMWQMFLGLLRWGIFMVIMSNSLISGFTTGAACYVFTYQLKYLFGIDVASINGMLKLVFIYVDFFSKISTTNWVTFSISISAIVILLLFNELIKPFIKKKYPTSRIVIPTELIVIILGILISYFLDLAKKNQVKTVQSIPTGFPVPQVPPTSLFLPLVFHSFVVALVALAINLSLAKIFARKDNYELSDNQEFIAYGASNILSSFFLCLPSAASLSRSTIQFTTGGKTQLTSLFSVFLIVLIILFAGPLFEPCPYCILSAIVVVTLKGLLFQIFDLPKIWKKSYWDGIVWLGTFLAVIILDISVGLAVGIILSVLTITCSSAGVQVNVMGRVPGTNIYLDLNHYKAAVPVPKILVLQVIGIINYTNCNKLEKRIIQEFKLFSTSFTEEQKYLVLHLGSTVKVDPTAVDMIKMLDIYLLRLNCQLYLTDCLANVYEAFEVCNLFSSFPKERVLASVDDAVNYLESVSQ